MVGDTNWKMEMSKFFFLLQKREKDNITMTNGIHSIGEETTRNQEPLPSKKGNHQYFLRTLLNNELLNYLLYEQMIL